MNEKTFTLTISEQDVQVLGQALGELPFKVAAGVITKINQQLMEQQKPAAEAEVPKVEAEPV